MTRLSKREKRRGTLAISSSLSTTWKSARLTRKRVESLIKAGALDCLNTNRAAHLAVYEGLVESAQNNAKKKHRWPDVLFQISSEEKPLLEITRKHATSHEKAS